MNTEIYISIYLVLSIVYAVFLAYNYNLFGVRNFFTKDSTEETIEEDTYNEERKERHSVNVVRISHIEKHPNADALDLIKIDGFTAISKRGQYKIGDLAIYVEPDYVVPTDHDLFSFLGEGNGRIKSRRLRGIWSQGLLVPALDGMSEGDDVMDLLGIKRYVPPVDKTSVTNVAVNSAPTPPGLLGLPKYDIENLRRQVGAFEAGEKIYVSEKIHGSNARFTYRDGQLHLGSRARWVKRDGNPWSRALDACPWIEEWCKANPDLILYGEVFGLQDLKYGLEKGNVSFLAFDIMKPDFTYVNAEDFVSMIDEDKRAPGWFDTFDFDKLQEDSLKNSRLAKEQISEGIVVRPIVERTNHKIGRVILKLVSDKYLERSKG